ncbi:MAG: hypothetical protein ACI8TQ_002098 [Planctomycetota bacterium]
MRIQVRYSCSFEEFSNLNGFAKISLLPFAMKFPRLYLRVLLVSVCTSVVFTGCVKPLRGNESTAGQLEAYPPGQLSPSLMQLFEGMSSPEAMTPLEGMTPEEALLQRMAILQSSEGVTPEKALLQRMAILQSSRGPEQASRISGQTIPERPRPVLKVHSTPLIAKPEVLPPTWTGSGRGTRPERRALIIAVDENQGGTALGFPAAGNGARALKDALSGLGFADVRILSGESASKPGIKRALSDLTHNLKGEGHKVLVTWMGHGFVPGSGQSEQQLLTYFSALSGDTKIFTNTLSSTELSEMLRSVRRPGIELGFILEACRTPIAGAPTKAPTKLKPAAEVECRTASGMHPALVPENLGMPLFTHHFVEALRHSPSAKISLLGALRAAIAGTEQNSRQGPEITTGATDMLLVDRSNLTITVQPLALNSRAPLTGAEVTLQGRSGERNRTTGAMTYSGLREGATYELSLTSEGHWGSQHFIDVGAKFDGRTIEVSLTPRYVDVEGVVLAESGESVRISVTGEFGDRVLMGYHVMRAEPAADGRFQLRVPASPNVHTLLVRSGNTVVSKKALDLKRGLNSPSPIQISIGELRTQAYASGN